MIAVLSYIVAAMHSDGKADYVGNHRPEVVAKAKPVRPQSKKRHKARRKPNR